MIDQQGDPDELVTLTTEPPTPDQRTDLYIGPMTDPDRYELLGQPMQGGEGTTWRARYRGDLDQPVQTAIKVLNRPHGAGAAWPPASLMRSWRDRVELLQSAGVPHVVRLHDVEIGCEPHRLGVADTPRTVLVRMEWVEGRTLSVAVGGQAPSRASLPTRLSWIDDLCVALAGLHSLGNAAVHRDVTPANCIVTEDRGLVLIDLSTMQLPHDGADLMGRFTPLYSAPEVIAAPHSPRSPAADRWSVGAIAFLCLTGSHPPRSALERSRQLHAAADLMAVPAVAQIVLELLDDDPASRPRDLRNWSERLREAALDVAPAGRRGRRMPWRRIAIAALVVIALAATTPLVLQRLGTPPERINTIATTKAAHLGTSTPPSASTPAAAVATATIAAPRAGAQVAACAVIKGTVRLPAGRTIVLVSRLDETDGATTPYVEYPAHFDSLHGDTAFIGAQYFNGNSVGQHFRIEVVQVDLATAKRQYAADSTETDYAGDSRLADGGTVVAGVRVVHSLPGTDATACDAVWN